MRKNNAEIFTFENIVFLSPIDMRILLENIDNLTLLIACSHANSLIFKCIKSALTNQAWNCFCEDLVKQPWPSDIEIQASKRKIGSAFEYLYANGKLQDWNKKYSI